MSTKPRYRWDYFTGLWAMTGARGYEFFNNGWPTMLGTRTVSHFTVNGALLLR